MLLNPSPVSAPEESTLFKILEMKEELQRKSFQDLDNTAADGASGFQTVEQILDDSISYE